MLWAPPLRKSLHCLVGFVVARSLPAPSGADDRAAVAEITDLIPGEPEVSPAALHTAAATLPIYVQEATGTVSDSANLDDGKPHRHGQQQRWTDEDAREIANYRKLSVRPPLAACTEKEFLDDYKLFHEVVRHYVVVEVCGSLSLVYVSFLLLSASVWLKLYRQSHLFFCMC
jgi:hypothetical protein